jgi:hypothetical protein
MGSDAIQYCLAVKLDAGRIISLGAQYECGEKPPLVKISLNIMAGVINRSFIRQKQE